MPVVEFILLRSCLETRWQRFLFCSAWSSVNLFSLSSCMYLFLIESSFFGIHFSHVLQNSQEICLRKTWELQLTWVVNALTVQGFSHLFANKKWNHLISLEHTPKFLIYLISALPAASGVGCRLSVKGWTAKAFPTWSLDGMQHLITSCCSWHLSGWNVFPVPEQGVGQESSHLSLQSRSSLGLLKKLIKAAALFMSVPLFPGPCSWVLHLCWVLCAWKEPQWGGHNKDQVLKSWSLLPSRCVALCFRKRHVCALPAV